MTGYIHIVVPDSWVEMIDEAIEKGLANTRQMVAWDAIRDYLKIHGLWREAQVSEDLIRRIEEAV